MSALMASAASAQYLIDDFSDVDDPTPWPVTIDEIATVQIHETGLNHVLGGSRHSTIRATFLAQHGLDYVTAAIVPNFGMVMDYSSSSGAEGDWNLLYDGDGAGLNADFSNMTEIAVAFDLFDYANNQDMPVTVSISDGNSLASLSLSLDHAGPQTLHFSFSDFDGIGQVDMSSIQGVAVFLEPVLATDFRIGSIGVIPTPGSMALLAMGSFALAGGRRRRHTNA